MRTRLYMVPIGPIIASSITVLGLTVQLYRLFGSGQTALTANLIVLAFLSLSAFIAVLWLLKTRNLIGTEIDLWCTNKETKCYRDHPGQVNYLNQAQIKYKSWLGKNWSIPSPEMRKSIFEQFVEAECNKTPEQKIREGLMKRPENKA
jgi:hypothetical protein